MAGFTNTDLFRVIFTSLVSDSSQYPMIRENQKGTCKYSTVIQQM